MKKSIAALIASALVISIGFAGVADAASKRGPRGLRGLRGHTGPKGATGAAGPAGPAGAPGKDAVGTGGITRIDFRGDIGTPLKILYSQNQLILQAECTTVFNLRAKAQSDNNSISAYQISSTHQGLTVNNDPQLFIDSDFDQGDSDTVFTVPFLDGSAHVDYAGIDGTAVTVSSYIGFHPANQVQGDCVFVGTAINS